jgi:hypothetical protein
MRQDVFPVVQNLGRALKLHDDVWMVEQEVLQGHRGALRVKKNQRTLATLRKLLRHLAGGDTLAVIPHHTQQILLGTEDGVPGIPVLRRLLAVVHTH